MEEETQVSTGDGGLARDQEVSEVNGVADKEAALPAFGQGDLQHGENISCCHLCAFYPVPCDLDLKHD